MKEKKKKEKMAIAKLFAFNANAMNALYNKFITS